MKTSNAMSVRLTAAVVAAMAGLAWAADKKEEAPKAETPKAEAPKAEAPKAESAKIEAKAEAKPAVGKPEGEGWVSLFNGRDLDGWKQINGTAKYSVDGDAILGVTNEGSPNSFLCSTRNYADFELVFEVKVDDALNSGVQIRSESKPDYQKGRVHGYQVEIATNGTAGFIYDEARRGKWLNPEQMSNEAAKKAFKKGEWNSYRVICQGSSIKTWVNGVAVSDMKDEMTATGFIGLQVHSIPKGKGPYEVRWRGLWLRELK